MKQLFAVLLLILSRSLSVWAQPSTVVEFTSSNLPIVVINTNGSDILDDPKIPATMGIIDNGPGQRNLITDPFNGYKGPIGIEFRGSFSQWATPKKSYGFETWTPAGESKDTTLLGMPAESDWVLTANYMDKSLLRNSLTYYLSAQTGYYASRSQFCEVVLNGVYQGVYVLGEKIKRGSNRVNVSKLKSSDNSGDNVTGGYIIKVDKITGSSSYLWHSTHDNPDKPYENGVFFQLEYPKLKDVTTAQGAYIEDYMDKFETVLASDNYADPTTGYRKYINTDSFIDYLLLTELTRNPDGYRSSTFLYKDKSSKGGKLTMGPVWDYDMAWRNANFCGADSATGWVYKVPCYLGNTPFWWRRFLSDPAFRQEVRARWTELRATTFSENTINDFIDATASRLDEGQNRNFQAWPIMGVYVSPMSLPIAGSYQEEITNLKQWIHNRLEWMDANLPSATPQIVTHTSAATSLTNLEATAYPNPTDKSLQVDLTLLRTSAVSITVSNTMGQTVLHKQISSLSSGKQTLILSEFEQLPASLYLLTVTTKEAKQVIKVFKQG